MGNGRGDDVPVTWGRYVATLAALEARLAALESAAGRRRDQAWRLTLMVLSGLALPVILLLIGVMIHRALGG